LAFSQQVFYPTNFTLPHIPWFARLKDIGRGLFRVPVLKRLKPWVTRALSVIHPPKLLIGRHYPHKKGNLPKEGLTILSANLWHDWPHHRRLADRLRAFAQMVEQNSADIVLLQEVARTPLIKTDEWLAQQLGMAYFYIRANGDAEAIGFEEGLAILSRFPLTDPQAQQLSVVTSPFTRRMALSAHVETPFGGLRAFCAHLGLISGHNANQVEHLHDWVSLTARADSAVIGGDFNAHETSFQIQKTRRSWLDTFRALHPEKDGTTHELKMPWGRILRRTRRDYLFVQPGDRCWQVLEASHLKPANIYLSDHQIVMARLKPVGCGG